MAVTTNVINSWGVSSTATVGGATGILTSLSISTEPIMAAQQNEIGQIIGQVRYDKHQSANGALIVPSSVTAGTGSTGTAGGVTGILTRFEVTESNQDFKKVNFTLESWAHCNTPTTASGATGF